MLLGQRGLRGGRPQHPVPLRQQARLGEVEEAREQLPLGKVTRGAEQDDDVVVRVVVVLVGGGHGQKSAGSSPWRGSRQTILIAVDTEHEKRLAAEAAAQYVRDGMAVGLGTGSTAAYLLPALARRKLSIRCVATSASTERAAAELGLAVEHIDTLAELDIAIDGADQITPDGWLIKGGGGAHTREKIVAASAARFIVIADSTKPVPALHPPVPLELLSFGLPATLHR